MTIILKYRRIANPAERKAMKHITLVVILFLCKLNYSQNKDTLPRFDCLEIRSLNDIIMADTNIVYDCIHVYEHDSLIHGIENLNKFHTLDFKYEGNLRKYFPIYSKNISRGFSKVEISGKKLQNIPSFICYDSLTFLLIEAREYKIKINLSKCLKMKKLYLTCNDTYNHIDEICQLENLTSLGIAEHSKKPINKLGCLLNLKMLESLTISINNTSLKELVVFNNLKDIGIKNKITYKDVVNNINLFQSYETISFQNFIGNKKQKQELKRKLKGLEWDVTF